MGACMPEDVTPVVLDMICGYFKTQMLCALASLSIADLLAEGPATPETLAQKTGANPDGLARLLRAVAALGIVRFADGRYASTAMLDILREGVPGSLKHAAIALAAPGHWLPWGRFTDAVMTGESRSKAALGLSHFDYYARNPEEAGQFIRFMQATSELVQAEAARVITVGDAATAVDVGGANGSLLCALLKANPSLRGVVCDLPHSRESAVAFAAEHGLSDRISFEGGDFFAAVPPADLYVLKFILHDWDDSRCAKILSNCRRAVLPGGRVVVIEMRLGEIGEPGFGPLADVNMLTVTGGRERTSSEYRRLLAEAGFEVASVTPTRSPFDLLEALPV
jgi:O-methyltransferase domain/Dimerisation domain